MNIRKCTRCKIEKPIAEFYKKGNRFDSRCKHCVCEIKAGIRGTAASWQARNEESREEKKCECSSRNTQAGLDIDSLTWEDWNVIIPKIQAEVGERKKDAIAEFKKGGLSAEEFNARHCRDDRKMYPKIENGEMKIVISTKIRVETKHVHPERVLRLYHEGRSIQQIGAMLQRSKKWVKNSLSRFGIRFSGEIAYLDPPTIPYGWKDNEGRFAPHEGEQWILEKIEFDRVAGRDFPSISKSLNSARIKSRENKLWNPELVRQAFKTHKHLKSVFAAKI